MSNHKARQQMRIIKAALGAIQKDGLSRVNMSVVAEAAGMTRQTLYNHFPDVESIIAAALNMHVVAMLQHLVETTTTAEGACEKLHAFAAFHIDSTSSEHENISLEIGLSAEARNQIAEHEHAVFALLETFILDGQKSGAFQKSGDTRLMTNLVQGVINGGVAAALRQPEQKPAILKAVDKAMLAILR